MTAGDELDWDNGESVKLLTWGAGANDDPRLNALIHDMEAQENRFREQHARLLANQQELKEANEKLLRLYHQAPVGYLTVDSNDIIIHANRTAARMVGRPLGELQETCITQLIAPADQDSYHVHRQAILRGDAPEAVELNLVGKKGGLFTVRLEGSAVFNSQENDRDLHIAISDINPSKHFRRIIRKSATFQRTLINSAPFAIIATDKQGTIRTVNPAAERMFGYTAQNLIGRYTPVQLMLHREIRAYAEKSGEGADRNLFKSLTHGVNADKLSEHEWTYIRHNGERRSMTLSIAAVYDNEANLSGYILESVDITNRKRQESKISELNRKLEQRIQESVQSQEKAETTLLAIADGIIITDSKGHIETINEAAQRMTGYKNVQAIGKAVEDVYVVESEEGVPAANLVMECLSNASTNRFGGSGILVSQSGKRIHIDAHVAPIKDKWGKVGGAVLVFRDVTHNIRLVKKMIYQASHDDLTGLINRREFNGRLKKLIAKRCGEGHPEHAFLALDLDRFKAVNDTSGHAAGDELLKQISIILLEHAGENATVARMGGDEFAVLLPYCSLESAYLSAVELLERIQDHRFRWEDHVFRIGASIGLKMFGSKAETVQQIHSQADVAAYSAKSAGRNRVHVCGEEAGDSENRYPQLEWVNRINRALDDDDLVLYSQCIWPLSLECSQDRPHKEILLRMQTAEHGLVLPTQFIPAAERYNLMPSIDRWVVKSAFDWLKKHPDDNGNDTLYSINLSGPSLSEDGFRTFLLDQFKQYDIPFSSICFEITETMGILNLKKTNKFIEHLRSLGCAFSLDDFGSGFSSYQHLKNLPVDYIKIDGDFVREAISNDVDFAMVKSIRDIGKAMGKRTIAEFVESEAILEKMRDIGVDFGQGYYFDKPEKLAH